MVLLVRWSHFVLINVLEILHSRFDCCNGIKVLLFGRGSTSSVRCSPLAPGKRHRPVLPRFRQGLLSSPPCAGCGAGGCWVSSPSEDGASMDPPPQGWPTLSDLPTMTYCGLNINTLIPQSARPVFSSHYGVNVQDRDTIAPNSCVCLVLLGNMSGNGSLSVSMSHFILQTLG